MSFAKPAPESRCRCFSRKRYKRCCGPYHQGQPAPTPEALMRSRYSAYALGDVEYIMRTTDPTGPHHLWDADVWREQIAHFCAQARFVGLNILDAPEATGPVGRVTFKAGLMAGDNDASFTEMSLFNLRDGQWLYHSAIER